MLVAATTSLVLIAFLVPIAVLLRSEAAERATGQASMEGHSIAQLLPDVAEGSLPADGTTTVFLADGRVIGARAATSPSVRLAQQGQSFIAETAGGREVLIGVQSGADGTSVVRVFVPASTLYDGVAKTWALLALLGLALFALGMVIADRLGRRLVRSVTALAETADRLSRGELTARVNPGGPPEIHNVGSELNRLADRIDELLNSARAEAADLAHRLRTPLTALRLDIGGLRDPVESERVLASLQDLSAQVDEIIRTARRPGRTGAVAMADLAAIARERLHFWAALAEDTGRPLTGNIPSKAVLVRIGAEDLAATFDVLLDNAFRHTPDSAAVRLVVEDNGVAWVEDAGTGIGPTAGTPGTTGLGLDIARRTVEAVRGSLTIGSSELGGAKVVLTIERLNRETAQRNSSPA